MGRVLANVQAYETKKRLGEAFSELAPEGAVEIKIIKTTGDMILDKVRYTDHIALPVFGVPASCASACGVGLGAESRSVCLVCVSGLDRLCRRSAARDCLPRNWTWLCW